MHRKIVFTCAVVQTGEVSCDVSVSVHERQVAFGPHVHDFKVRGWLNLIVVSLTILIDAMPASCTMMWFSRHLAIKYWGLPNYLCFEVFSLPRLLFWGLLPSPVNSLFFISRWGCIVSLWRLDHLALCGREYHGLRQIRCGTQLYNDRLFDCRYGASGYCRGGCSGIGNHLLPV